MKKIKKTTINYAKKLAKKAQYWEKDIEKTCIFFRPGSIARRNHYLNKINELLHCDIRYEEDRNILFHGEIAQEIYQGNYKPYLCHVTQMDY